MKATTMQERFVTDAAGKRVGVLLDLDTYQRLREAEEALAEVRAYDAARPGVMAEMRSGRWDTLQDYRANRRRKRR